MLEARAEHACVVLPQGLVLVVGGQTRGGGITNSAELYDPGANQWLSVGSMAVARAGASATLLQDGRVLIAGGRATGAVVRSLEIFDPNSRRFTALDRVLSSPRARHAAAGLSDGRVLIAGGWDGEKNLDTVDVFDPATGSIEMAFRLSSPRAGLSATRLLTGDVLFAGGNDGEKDLDTADLYSVKTGNLSATMRMPVARRDHQAVTLPDNNTVVLVGGTSSGVSLSRADVYVPWERSFRDGGAIGAGRLNAAAVAVKRSGVLTVLGGESGKQPIALTTSATYATLTSDLPDYSPGMTVVLTGSGWDPNETVRITMAVDPKTHSDVVIDAHADAAGNVTDSSYVVQQSDLNVTFYVTAVGLSSGRTAGLLTFTDAQGDGAGTMTISPTSVNTSTAATYTLTFKAPNNRDFSSGAQVQVTIPSGWTAPQTASGAGQITTSAGSCSGVSVAGIVGQVVTVNMTCARNNSLTITYSSAVSQSTAGSATFITKTKNAGGTLTTISNSPSVQVNLPAIKFAITSVNGGSSPRYGTAFSVTVVSQNVNSVAANVTADTDVNLGVATGNGSLTGAITGTISAGSNSATLSGVFYNLAESGVSLRATRTSGDNLTPGVSSTFSVLAAPLTITAGNASKVYGDTVTYGAGSTAFTSSGLKYTDTVGTVTLASAGGAATAAATTYSITPSAATGGTFNTGNYSITYVPGTLTVTKAPLTVTANDDTKTYGVTKTYGAGSTAFTSSGLKNSETIGSVTITASGGTTATAPVGSYSLTPSAATGGTFTAGNYAISYVAGHLNVGAATASATVTAANKTYNGTSTATITGCSLSGVLPADAANLTCSATSASFANKNAASGKTVTASVILEGSASGNYTLASPSVTTTANITARTLTVTISPSNKVYDGTTAASVTFNDDRILGDVLSVSAASATFASRNVGTWTVTASGISLGGADAGNYSPNTTASGTASITQRSITVTAIAATKLYDGNTTSTQVPAIAPGLGTGDTANFVEAYVGAGAGGNKVMNPSGSVNDGNSGANYSVTFVSTNAGIITPRLSALARSAQLTATWTPYSGATLYTLELLDTVTNTTTTQQVTGTSLLVYPLVNGRAYNVKVTPDNGPSTNTVSVVPKGL